jgi:hypothetical protein
MIRYMVKFGAGACNGYAGLAALISSNTSTKNNVSNVVSGLTRVTGLSLGEEGQIDVPEWDTRAIISDGKRTLPTLGLQFRVDSDLKTLDLIASIFNNRASTTLNISVYITKRDWTPLYIYEYIDCEIRSFTQEDQELGQSKLGLIDCVFAPYNVLLRKADGTAYYVQN